MFSQEDNRGGAPVPGRGGDGGVPDCLRLAQPLPGYPAQWEAVQPLLLQ